MAVAVKDIRDLDSAAEFQVGKTDLHTLGLVGGIVEGDGTGEAATLQEVFCQDVGTRVEVMLNDLGLKSQRVLIDSDEVAVFQEGQRMWFQFCHVAADE